MSKDSVAITGLWVRRGFEHLGGRLEVLVEVNGEWRKVLVEERPVGHISHIVEPAGILQCPKDDLR